ncbi:MAG: 3-phosphoserine/phosphohydroxythreonine transaminase [Gammaproteobacteria bacterium]|nr:3-phosphoserine/phosphohydroxythreonine transaminase [Gammaproteobacteria bacterium]
MSRTVYNFGAGPAMLPRAVMERAQEELLDWHGTGISIIEMSHRSPEFESLAAESERDLRVLLSIPDDYYVLFLQGGATSQFAMVPLNLTTADGTADYVRTGHWSDKAIRDAQRHCRVHVAAGKGLQSFTTIPDPQTWELSDAPAYVYYTSNETIGGLEFQYTPDVGELPLVSDMTSNFLSRPIDVARHGVIYAGAQKNYGPSGFVVVIVRKDLVGHAQPSTPRLYDYKEFADSKSLINTPPTFSWYMAALTFEWIRDQGGVAAMERNAIRRSDKLYRIIDDSDFYRNPIERRHRSRMNVVFTLPDKSLDDVFVKEAAAAGLVALKGHRVVGGIRASLYNGMPDEGVDALIDFMRDFERRHG